jgi:hypothetical protein
MDCLMKQHATRIVLDVLLPLLLLPLLVKVQRVLLRKGTEGRVERRGECARARSGSGGGLG